MRMPSLYDLNAPKKSANLSVNSDLLAHAKQLGINISAVLEQSLAQKVKELTAQAWLEENRNAIAKYNQEVEEHGVFSDGVRSF
jgi:antitoxin CcdA